MINPESHLLKMSGLRHSASFLKPIKGLTFVIRAAPGPHEPLGYHKRTFFTLIQNYERGLVFRAGRHSGEKEPGFRWSFPAFNEVRKVDMRTRTMRIRSQELITKDNVTIHVDAVALYSVTDAFKALW